MLSILLIAPTQRLSLDRFVKLGKTPRTCSFIVKKKTVCALVTRKIPTRFSGFSSEYKKSNTILTIPPNENPKDVNYTFFHFSLKRDS